MGPMLLFRGAVGGAGAETLSKPHSLPKAILQADFKPVPDWF